MRLAAALDARRSVFLTRDGPRRGRSRAARGRAKAGEWLETGGQFHGPEPILYACNVYSRIVQSESPTSNVDHHLHELTRNAAQRAEEIPALVSSQSIPPRLVNRLTVMLAISSMEGLAYQLKDRMADDADIISKLSDLFPYFLAGSDTQTRIDDNGTLRSLPARHRSLPHILFSLRFAAFCLDLPLNPYTVAGWRYVKTTFAVRDRVIHPRKESDLDVSEGERNDALKAFLWYKRCLSEIERKAATPGRPRRQSGAERRRRPKKSRTRD